jgi:DNA-binding NtrC family response regulator
MAAKLCHDVPIPLKDFMGELEKEVILLVLHKVGGNQRGAANILGMKHTTLHQKLKRYQIRVRKTSSIE